MEHQRLNDLVYIRYNLRLHQKYEKCCKLNKKNILFLQSVLTSKLLNCRISFRGKNYDPISFEDFVDNCKWILEDDPPLLTVDEIEEFRKQMAALKIQTNEDNGKSFIN